MTKKELLKAIEDMPMDATIVLVDDEGNGVVADYVDVSYKFNQIEIS
jgi:hypothetical protein